MSGWAVKTCLVVASAGIEGKNGILHLLNSRPPPALNAAAVSVDDLLWSSLGPCAAPWRNRCGPRSGSPASHRASQIAVRDQPLGRDGVVLGGADDAGTFDQAVHVVEIGADRDGVEQGFIVPAGVV